MVFRVGLCWSLAEFPSWWGLDNFRDDAPMLHAIQDLVDLSFV